MSPTFIIVQFPSGYHIFYYNISLNTNYSIIISYNTYLDANCTINGFNITTKSYTPLITASTFGTNIEIGRIWGGITGIEGYANEIIYDLKVFNKPLTQAEVTELYLKQGQIVPSTAIVNLQLDMRFNDKSGTIALDRSGNNYHGTLVNYAAGTTDLGATNSWCDKYGNSLTAY